MSSAKHEFVWVFLNKKIEATFSWLCTVKLWAPAVQAKTQLLSFALSLPKEIENYIKGVPKRYFRKTNVWPVEI